MISHRALAWPTRWGWPVALVALTLVTRYPALSHPKGINDERIYSIVAIEMLEGGRPYVDAVERKPPLLFWTYTAILGLVGRYNVFGLHLVAVVWVLLTMVGLYAVARALFDRAAGYWAALLYCIYQPWLLYANLGFNGEVLMNLPLVWAVFFTMRAGPSRLRPELILAGLLVCAAFLLKQPAAIAAVPLVLYLLWPGYRTSRRLLWRHSLLHATWFAGGFFGALALVALVLHAQGILADAYYWTITDHDLPFIAWKQGLAMSAAFIGFGWPMVGAALISMTDLQRREPRLWLEKQPELLALAMLLVVSAAGVAASGRFYQHYYIQLILPLALLAAPVLAQSTGRAKGSGLRAGGSETRAPALSPLPSALIPQHTLRAWLAVCVLVSFISHSIALAERREISEVGQYISARSTPDDRMFVWGQAEGLYLDARRRPASRYITTYRLTGQIYGWPETVPVPDTRERILPGAWDVFEREMIARPPRFIVDAEAVRAPDQQYPMAHFPAIRQLVEQRYRLVHKAPEGWIYERVSS